jgi:hypothetical protein
MQVNMGHERSSHSTYPPLHITSLEVTSVIGLTFHVLLLAQL